MKVSCNLASFNASPSLPFPLSAAKARSKLVRPYEDTKRYLFVDARRYFKQSEIVLYRQAPEFLAEQAELARQQPATAMHSAPPVNQSKVAAAAA